ncbi:MAG: hypothetical protein JJ966_02590 [Balneolaceae bacterium]|jgi:hypothetical protein|nr:hypothetical protein [Balneolaceae bacterium]MCR9132682.1 hypothetical protein [bacterium]
MNNKTLFNNLFLYSILGLAIVASACSNSTSADDHDEHSEPEGFVLTLNGADVVTQLPGATITGEFELAPGEETDLITIYFIDEDGDRFQPDEPEYSLGFEFEDSGIAEFEQHSEDGKWSFHIHAEAAGITDLRLKLMHNDHSDFTTQGIHVHVE